MCMYVCDAGSGLNNQRLEMQPWSCFSLDAFNFLVSPVVPLLFSDSEPAMSVEERKSLRKKILTERSVRDEKVVRVQKTENDMNLYKRLSM